MRILFRSSVDLMIVFIEARNRSDWISFCMSHALQHCYEPKGEKSQPQKKISIIFSAGFTGYLQILMGTCNSFERGQFELRILVRKAKILCFRGTALDRLCI